LLSRCHAPCPIALRFPLSRQAAIELLVAAGANVGTTDHGGLTPLHIACEKGRADAAVCLLRHGADLTARDSIGRTPFDWAEAKGHEDVAAALAVGPTPPGSAPGVL